MEIFSFSNIASERWNEVVSQSDDGWSFSLAGWLEMVTPIWNMENLSFAILENAKVVAVMPLHWIAAEKRLSSCGWGHGGPAILSGVSLKDRRRLWRAAFAHVEEIAAQLKAKRITASISPLCRSSLTNHWGVNPLVEVGYADVSTHTRIIDLQKVESDLWLGLAQDARQRIKRARSLGYTVKRCVWREMVDEYYRVHVETYQRTGVQPYPKTYFEGIANQSSQYCVLWVGFDPSGSPVAFHNDARFGLGAMYHTGCSETAHLESGINYLLFWEAILGEKMDGILWYESGEAFPQAKQGKDKSLTSFKAKFGGELHRLYRGEMEIVDTQHGLLSNLSTNITPGRIALHAWLIASRDFLSAVFGPRIPGMFKKFASRFSRIGRQEKHLK